jgi:hypothetical protein
VSFLTALFTLFACMAGLNAEAQTTEFTYQGHLQNAGVAANGSFDFEFLLFDSLAGGSQLGTTLTRVGVGVTNGIFGVKLDFGSNFTGAGRFLEIRVQQMGGGLTLLTPRQAVTSAPYTIRSLSAASADSVAGVLGIANGGTGIGPMFPPSNTYLRSNGSGWQAAGISASDVPSNITVAAGGITGVLGTSQGGTGLGLASIPNNTYLRSNGSGGWSPGGIGVTDVPPGNTNYVQNTATQQASSNFNVSGTGTANILNATTQYNIGGVRAFNVRGTDNVFVGVNAGDACTGCNSSTIVGKNAGFTTVNGPNNAFFGFNAGIGTVNGGNVFVGSMAGQANTGGTSNTGIGFNADVGANLNFATAIGAGAVVTQSSSVVLGTTNVNVGVGVTAPKTKLHVAGGNVYIAGSPNGIIMASPNGTCYKITVLDGGALTTSVVACP